MNSLKVNVILLSLLTLAIITLAQEDAYYLYHFCQNATTSTLNSTYRGNLNLLLSSLASNATPNNTIGFYNTSFGQNTDQVYGLFICRGDLSSTTVCQNCVTIATKDIVQRCPIGIASIVYYDACILRYSNVNFFSKVDQSLGVSMANALNITTEPQRFNNLVGATVNDLAARAASAPPGAKKFAVNKTYFDAFQNIYSLAQCTPDLSSFDCNQCLSAAIAGLPNCCSSKIGGRVFRSGLTASSTSAQKGGVSTVLIIAIVIPIAVSIALFSMCLCFLRRARKTRDYVPENDGKDRVSTVVIIAIVVPVGVSIALFCLGFCFLRRRGRKNRDSVKENDVGDEISTEESLQFDLSTIEAATNNFSPDNKLGEGGFGRGHVSIIVIVAIVIPIAVSMVLFCMGFGFLRRRARKNRVSLPEKDGNSSFTFSFKPPKCCQLQLVFHSFIYRNLYSLILNLFHIYCILEYRMARSIWLSVFYTVILYFPLIVAQQFGYRYHICTNDSTYTTNSSFPLNLNASLSSLYEDASRSDDFSTISVGQNSDGVYALFLCRGDNSPELCQGCIKTTSEDIMIRCPNYKEAIIWYDRCMLRYSNRSIFSVKEEWPKVRMSNVNDIGDVTDQNQFNANLGGLMNQLITRAVSSSNLFAMGDTNETAFNRIYGTVQCTPDISPSQCRICLSGCVSDIPSCCNGKQGGNVLTPSCSMRFETYLFYTAPPAPPPPASSPSPPTPPATSLNPSGRLHHGQLYTFQFPLVPLWCYCSPYATVMCTRKQGRNTTLFKREMAWKQWKNGAALELMDASLGDSYSRIEITRCLHIALLCVQEDPNDRPTLSTIVLMLTSFSVTLPLPRKPAYCVQSRTVPTFPTTELESDRSTSKSKPLSVNDMSITELYPPRQVFKPHKKFDATESFALFFFVVANAFKFSTWFCRIFEKSDFPGKKSQFNSYLKENKRIGAKEENLLKTISAPYYILPKNIYSSQNFFKEDFQFKHLMPNYTVKKALFSDLIKHNYILVNAKKIIFKTCMHVSVYRELEKKIYESCKVHYDIFSCQNNSMKTACSSIL
ncbi:hypothetical protein NC651_010111 [Populus alba x Populus x berolinensis]|nr:hypothetical protein NC651_010111 [Populus alba x Populus x berolinensis]